MTRKTDAIPTGFNRAWLVLSNAAMFFAWARVLRTMVRSYGSLLRDPSDDFDEERHQRVCVEELLPDLFLALMVSFAEVLNAVAGVTRSQPQQVLLFCCVRTGVELYVGPKLPSCAAWQHLWTVACWSLGDTVRFGCFVVDSIVPGGTLAKAVRYTVGPIMFPLGAMGEVFMVLLAASGGRKGLYVAALLWPAGFFPLMKQLLKQRRKFFAKLRDEAETAGDTSSSSTESPKKKGKVKSV